MYKKSKVMRVFVDSTGNGGASNVASSEPLGITDFVGVFSFRFRLGTWGGHLAGAVTLVAIVTAMTPALTRWYTVSSFSKALHKWRMIVNAFVASVLFLFALAFSHYSLVPKFSSAAWIENLL